MNKFIRAALLALPLTMLGQSAAWAGGCGDCCTPLYRVGISVGLVFRGWCGCDTTPCKAPGKPLACAPCAIMNGGQCGGGACGTSAPWYGYWPYPAHFQTPAPTGYPYWPPAMSYGAGFAAAPPMGAPMNVGYAAAAPTGGMGPAGMSQMPVGGNFGGYPTSAPGMYTANYGQAPAYWNAGR